MSLKTKSTAAAIAVLVGLSGTTIANPAQAAGLGTSGASDSKSPSKKKSSDKKSSAKKKSSKKSKKAKIAAKRKKIVKIAKSKRGASYRSGKAGPKSFDCSGFTKYVYKKAGIKLPRTSSSQKSAGKKYSVKKAKAGDIIWSPGHVGIVVKKGKMIDAGNPRVDVSQRSYNWMKSSGAKIIRVKALRS